MIFLLRWLLFPFSLIYHLVVWIRNKCYDLRIFHSQSFDIPIIVVGNLAVGGTGKSPLTEYLIRLLKKDTRIATLSRGYGRTTKGFRRVDTSSSAREVGDEPLQFKRKFPDIQVYVCENRCYGIEQIKASCDVILLDDAFQHRKLKPGFSVLLFDFQSLMNPILMLPTGNFRDELSSAKRADCIVITKCPTEISDFQRQQIERKLRKHSNAPLFYSTIAYDMARDLTGHKSQLNLNGTDVLLLSGIANPKPLSDYLTAQGCRIELLSFPDHHQYEEKDYKQILSRFEQMKGKDKIILTTEKDIQRIDTTLFKEMPLFYIPIRIQFLDQKQEEFDLLIKNYISSRIR